MSRIFRALALAGAMMLSGLGTASALTLAPYTNQTFGPAFGPSTALPGANVTVYLYGTTTKATLYGFSAGLCSASTPLSNPLLADANGLVSFCADVSSSYQANWSLGAYTSPTVYLPQSFPALGSGVASALTLPLYATTAAPGALLTGGSVAPAGGLFDNICSSTLGQTWVRLTSAWGCSSLGYLNPIWFGADPTGSTDSEPAWASAIAALPSAGGEIRAPCGTYLLNSTLHIGNGTSSSVSTRGGVRIKGFGQSNQSVYGGNTCVLFTPGAGLSGGTMLEVDGPLSGWGFEDINIYCASSANVGLAVWNATGGWSRDIVVSGCLVSDMMLTTHSSSGYSGVVFNTAQNVFENVLLSPVDANLSTALFLDGSSDLTTDSSFNYFFGLNIFINPQSGSHSVYGIHNRVADSNFFVASHIYGTLNNSSHGVYDDYSVNSGWPASNVYIGLDCGSGGSSQFWGINGTQGRNIHFLSNLQSANGCVYPTNLGLNYNLDLPKKFSTDVNQLAITAAISSTYLYNPYPHSIGVRVCWYANINAVGTGSGSLNVGLTWDDGNGSLLRTVGSIPVVTTYGYSSGCLPIWANQPTGGGIYYQTSYSGTVSSNPNYNLRIWLERLD